MLLSKQERIAQITEQLQEKFHLAPEQITEMVPNFIAALSSHLERLEHAWQAGDLGSLGKAGHTMKGALLNLGINDCVELAVDIEQRGKAQDATFDYEPVLRELRRNLEVLFD